MWDTGETSSRFSLHLTVLWGMQIRIGGKCWRRLTIVQKYQSTFISSFFLVRTYIAEPFGTNSFLASLLLRLKNNTFCGRKNNVLKYTTLILCIVLDTIQQLSLAERAGKKIARYCTLHYNYAFSLLSVLDHCCLPPPSPAAAALPPPPPPILTRQTPSSPPPGLRPPLLSSSASSRRRRLPEKVTCLRKNDKMILHAFKQKVGSFAHRTRLPPRLRPGPGSLPRSSESW